MSIEIAVKKAKKIEGLLKKLGCSGAGIYDLTVSGESELDRNVVRACRKVATIRNKVVHEDGFTIAGWQLGDFIETADFAICELQEQLDRREAAARAAQRVQSQIVPERAPETASAESATVRAAKDDVNRDGQEKPEQQAPLGRKFNHKQFWLDVVKVGAMGILATAAIVFELS